MSFVCTSTFQTPIRCSYWRYDLEKVSGKDVKAVLVVSLADHSVAKRQNVCSEGSATLQSPLVPETYYATSKVVYQVLCWPTHYPEQLTIRPTPKSEFWKDATTKLVVSPADHTQVTKIQYMCREHSAFPQTSFVTENHYVPSRVLVASSLLTNACLVQGFQRR